MDKMSVEELINIAINIEINGQFFYKFAEKNTKDKESQKLFKMLIKEEIEHEELFREMLSEKIEIETTTDYEDQLKGYISLLSKQQVFTEELLKTEFVQDISNRDALLIFAIKMEKESVVYYTSLKPLFKNKDIIEKIIAIEIGHLLKLSEILNS